MTKDSGNKEFQSQEAALFDQTLTGEAFPANEHDSVLNALDGNDGFADPGDEPASPEDDTTARQEALLEKQIENKKLAGERDAINDSLPAKGESQGDPVEKPQGPPEPQAQKETPPQGDDEVVTEEPPKFTEDSLSMAGITAEEAEKSFPSEAALLAAVAWQDKQSMLVANQVPGQQRSNAPAAQQQFQQQVPPMAPQQGQPQFTTPQPPAGPAPPAQPQKEFELNLDPEVWGQDSIDLLNRMNDHYQQQNQATAARTQQLEAALSNIGVAMKQREAQASAKEAEQRFDDFDTRVNSLPEGYSITFGTGTRHTLKGTPQFNARVRLNTAMNAIASGRKLQGMEPLDSDKLFDRAIRAEFSEIHETAVREDTTSKVTKRLAQHLARPTAREGKPLSKDVQAQANVNKFLQERGLGSDGLRENEVIEI